MDEVAAAAGVRKATLYAYFDAKSALIDAVIDELLRELPVMRRTDETLPLRQQLIGVGLQLQKLAARPATVALAMRLAERRLSAEQRAAWRRWYEELENSLARLLEYVCDCERPKQVAQLFLLAAVGDLFLGSTALRIAAPPRIENTVDLILRVCPQRCSSQIELAGP